MDDKPKALLFMMLGALAFTAMSVLVKLAGPVPVFEKVFFRNLVSMLVALVVVLKQHRRPLGSWKHQPYLMGRSLSGLVGVIAFFYAIDHLHLVDAEMLNKISPFFVMVFAALFLGEGITTRKIVSLCIAFGGAVLVIKPRFDVTVLPALIGLSSAMLAGSAYSFLRALKTREKPETVVFHFSFVSVVAMIPLMLPVFVMPDAATLAVLVGIGVMAALGQFSLTYAYRYAPASEVSILLYVIVLFSAVAGLAFFDEIPDIYSVLGGVLIIAAAWISYRVPAGAKSNRGT